ncbi:hypothetical protein G6011_01853 [Alternaria panax]|uniref:Uncharacterized protein n=1 Tax=Alternaria panax TaxID=48097 RepID=A0AAD4FDB5_9PLEO|nr:hypothetical protein G6011_01853 [Alternaria panax]
MEYIKQEPSDGPTGLVPRLPIEVLLGFEREEWEKLTEGYNYKEDEVRDTIATRGQVGSRKGRPTNLKVPFKGALSSSSRAVAQRDRAALLDAETKALESASGADRAARYQLKKKIKSSDKYKNKTVARQQELLKTQQEELDEKRYRTCKSAEWLQTKLDQIHQKWAHAYHEVDLRNHSRVLEKASQAHGDSTTTSKSRTQVRIYGLGGVLEKIMRTTYNDGLVKLKSDSFKSKEAKKEWQIEPESIVDALGYSNDVVLRSDKPYYIGDDSDKCEEEADIDTEIDELYNKGDNEYKTKEQ